MPIFQPEIECASRDYLHALQSARLIRMVNNAYEHVPFYRRKFDEMGLKPGDIHSIDDIGKLPFTVKTDLRDNYPYGLFAVPPRELVRIHASSGTTGKQTVVGYTQHDIQVWAEGAARALSAAGATRDDFIHVSYGYGLFTGGFGLQHPAAQPAERSMRGGRRRCAERQHHLGARDHQRTALFQLRRRTDRRADRGLHRQRHHRGLRH